MRSLRLRLAVWFGMSFLVISVVFALFSQRLLDKELREKTWRKDYFRNRVNIRNMIMGIQLRCGL